MSMRIPLPTAVPLGWYTVLYRAMVNDPDARRASQRNTA